MCVFLGSSNTGNWDGYLPNLGFTKATGLQFDNYPLFSYCKKVPDPATLSPLPPPDVSYQFPAVGTAEFTHAICVLGASKASATSNDPDLGYNSIPDFQNGVKMWDDRTYTSKNVQGEELCQGGIYLKPTLARVSIV